MFLFGTNLKMHQTPQETRAFVQSLRERIECVPHIEQAALWVIPPFTSIEAAADEARGSRITIGAQNMHWADEGAYTGEISPTMLRASGAEFVMLGHAERRTLFAEGDEMLNKKVLAAAKHGLDIMLCVGEPANVRQADKGDVYVAQQLKIALSKYVLPLPWPLERPLTSPPRGEESEGHGGGGRLTVLYEPLWSVGAGGTAADPAYVGAAFANIRRTLIDCFGGTGARVPILYGGSVDAHNCARYAQLPQTAGMGVGRAGLSVDSFIDVLTNALAARAELKHRGAETQSE